MKNLSFAYPHPADSELRFLDIKIATLKKLAQKDSSDYIAEDLYAYQDARNEAKKSSQKILQSLNMQFETGKLYGIVGKNGAGKTTFTSLLL